jgi:hypothetical protein
MELFSVTRYYSNTQTVQTFSSEQATPSVSYMQKWPRTKSEAQNRQDMSVGHTPSSKPYSLKLSVSQLDK